MIIIIYPAGQQNYLPNFQSPRCPLFKEDLISPEL